MIIRMIINFITRIEIRVCFNYTRRMNETGGQDYYILKDRKQDLIKAAIYSNN